MQPTTSNLFHTSLAFLPSSLTARRRKNAGTMDEVSQWRSARGCCFGTRGMGASSWGVVSIALRRITLGGNA